MTEQSQGHRFPTKMIKSRNRIIHRNDDRVVKEWYRKVACSHTTSGALLVNRLQPHFLSLVSPLHLFSLSPPAHIIFHSIFQLRCLDCCQILTLLDEQQFGEKRSSIKNSMFDRWADHPRSLWSFRVSPNGCRKRVVPFDQPSSDKPGPVSLLCCYLLLFTNRKLLPQRHCVITLLKRKYTETLSSLRIADKSIYLKANAEHFCNPWS